MKINDTEKRILLAALELFVRNGFHGTSIDDIMAKVRLTKGAFYSHFDSKNALFMRLLESYRHFFIGGLVEAIETCEGNALDKLNRVISHCSTFAVEHTYLCVFLTFLTTELNSDVNFEPALKGIYLEYQKIISKVISDGQKQQLLKQELDPDLAALTFMALHDGILHQWVLHRQYIDGEKLVRTFRGIYLNGLVDQDAAKRMSVGDVTETATRKSQAPIAG